MLKATANIAIKTCHFPKLAPASSLFVWAGRGEVGNGTGGFWEGLPTSSCFLGQVFVQELGIREQGRKLAESLISHRTDMLAEKG